MRNLIVFALLLLTTACGYDAVYGDQKGANRAVENQLNVVAIDNIPDRSGQYLRNLLMDRFYRTGEPAKPVYHLTVTITETRNDLGIAKDASVTRSQMILRTGFALTNAQTGQVLLQKNVTSLSGFSILDNQYATLVNEQDARNRNLQDAAERITTQLSLYFNQKKP
jgi:LPS-assembly lipoprotein